MRCVNAVQKKIFYTFSWLTLISHSFSAIFWWMTAPFFSVCCHLVLHFTSLFILLFFCCHQLKFPLHTSSFRCVCHLFATRRICSVQIQPEINVHAHIKTQTNKQTNQHVYESHVNHTVCECIELYAAWTMTLNRDK